jgi:hypothetical protein
VTGTQWLIALLVATVLGLVVTVGLGWWILFA